MRRFKSWLRKRSLKRNIRQYLAERMKFVPVSECEKVRFTRRKIRARLSKDGNVENC